MSERTRERVARELRDLKQSGRADAEVLQNYAIYLRRVQDLVDENRRLVRKMKALCSAGASLSAEAGGTGDVRQRSAGAPGEESADEVTRLDRRLNESLASFDEMLHKRLDAIKAESAGKMRDLAQQAAQAAERAHQRASGSAGSSRNGRDGRRAERPHRGREGSRQGQETAKGQGSNRRGTSSDTAKSGSSGRAATRQGSGQLSTGRGASTDVGASAAGAYNRADDDIVARQLREAAEQEKDPQLKKKLWKEYVEYKKNTRK